MDQNYLRQLCWCCMNKYVGIKTNDGKSYDGFIAEVDQDHVILAVPTDEMMEQMQGQSAERVSYRQFGFQPGFFPRRRFFRRRIPFSTIAALFLLPFFI